MGWLRRKPDPIANRARALNDEIAALESQIQELNQRVGTGTPPARKTEGTSRAAGSASGAGGAKPPRAPHEPVFEKIDRGRVQGAEEPASTTAHYNELGVRKYDLPAAWNRIRNHFQGPPSSNPKLVNYLAAGSIQGLRPLRYEKRVARNRLVFLGAILGLILWGIIHVLMRR